MEKNYLLFKRPNNFEEDPNEKLNTFCSEKNREIFLKTQKISTARHFESKSNKYYER